MDKFVEIEMSKIVPNEDNDKVFSMKEIKLLADTIKDQGFYGGIEVFKIPGKDKYEISSGHRRYAAMKLLGADKIPCIVSEYPSDYKRGIKMLASNIRTRKLSPLDMARAIEYYDNLLKKEGLRKDFKKQASEFFNMSPIQVYRHQCLLRLIPELQALANDPQFPYSAFREAATLSIKGQQRLYKEISYFLTAQEDNDDKEYRLTRARIEQLIGNIKEDEQRKTRHFDTPEVPDIIFNPAESISYSPLNITLAPEDELVVKPRTVAKTNEYKKPAFDIKDEFDDEFMEEPEEIRQDEVLVLRVSEKISAIDEDIERLPADYQKKIVDMLKELVKKYK